MRILVCGAPCSETEEFVDEYVKKYPKYASHVEKFGKASMNPDNLVDVSKIDSIFEQHAENAIQHGKDEYLITEGGVVADLVMVYMFIAMHAKEVDKEKMKKFTALFYYSVFNYDVIFFLPIASKIKRYLPEIDKEEFSLFASMDSFFEAICKQNENRNSTLFPFDEKSGSPPIIRIPGDTVAEQIDIISRLYVNEDGNMDTVEVNPLTKSVIDSVVDPMGKNLKP